MIPGRVISRDHTSFIHVPNSQTPVYIPTHSTPVLQYQNANQGLSRADYALLHNSGFQEVIPNKNDVSLLETNPPITKQAFPSRTCLSVQLMAFQLPPNPIANILEGYASLAMIEAPKQVFCTYKLFKWQPNTTPKLNLYRKENKNQDKRSCPYVLMEETAAIPGYLSGYQVTCETHVEELVSYLQKYKVQLDIWDGGSLMLIGSGFVSLKELVTNVMESVQVIKEVEISSLDVFSSNDLLVLDQNGQFCHSQGRTIHQGTLVIRFGYQPDFSESHISNFEHFYSLDRTENNTVLKAVRQHSATQARRVSKV